MRGYTMICVAVIEMKEPSWSQVLDYFITVYSEAGW